jgi:hypothetical protein
MGFMNQTSNVDAVIARRKKIAEEAAKLQDQLSRLKAEDAELETALRVLARFGQVTLVAKDLTIGGNGKLGPPRPEGTPSLFEMTQMVLKDAVAAGKPGLRGSEIVGEIRKKWWPGLENRQVLPPIYSFAKKGRLKKTESGVFKPV